jgi:hypothetical protein
VPEGSKDPDAVDLEALGREVKKQLTELGAQFKTTLEKVSEDAQFEFDKQMARALAKHPELFAQVRKTLREAQKTMDKAAEALGLKEK